MSKFIFWRKNQQTTTAADSSQNKNSFETISDKSRALNVKQLKQRTDQVISGIQSIGLRAVALNNEELTELFYNFYNPEVIEKENLGIVMSATKTKESES